MDKSVLTRCKAIIEESKRRERAGEYTKPLNSIAECIMILAQEIDALREKK